MREPAGAKVNLCLEVTGRLPDGYHGVRTVLQSLEFGDTVELEPGEGPWQVRSGLSYLPGDGENLAARAAVLFRRLTGLGPEGGVITLEKRIPVCGGFGGGSSDAAAVLRLLNREYGSPLSWTELETVGLELGVDVPFCIRGGTALGEGKGELLTSLPDLSGVHVVLCRPGFLCSTPELFRSIDRLKLRLKPDVSGMVKAVEDGDLPGVARRMFNVFESVLNRSQADQVQTLKSALLDGGALGAAMTGSGSGVFAVFGDETAAEAAAVSLRGLGFRAEHTVTTGRLAG
ncbi:MAG: 4-(cytidine 5'-diphospho)-2-C-methyl-D-erythritol kinase [Oscillospiraceae bacterium]|nr:4-(cytidine 5'-diphospho)-2-C-methyl-D-erythritol kinase [Oscillospiraceae bacterium]